MGVPFEGVPLGTFDFGGGSLPVGSTDTIVHRLDTASAPSTAISTELVALQLMTSVPTDFGLGVDTYFVTLQSVRGGPTSPGRMTINFGPEGPIHGTFDSFFDVFFDIRKGSLSGPIALSDDLELTSLGIPWSHDPPPGHPLLPEINFHLNGQNRDNDFFPVALQPIVHNAAGAAHHVVIPTGSRLVPDGGATATLLVLGLFGVVSFRNRSCK